MAFRWGAEYDPTLDTGLVVLRFFRGSGPVLLRNPIFLRFFMEWGSGPTVPTLWLRAYTIYDHMYLQKHTTF